MHCYEWVGRARNTEEGYPWWKTGVQEGRDLAMTSLVISHSEVDDRARHLALADLGCRISSAGSVVDEGGRVSGRDVRMRMRVCL